MLLVTRRVTVWLDGATGRAASRARPIAIPGKWKQPRDPLISSPRRSSTQGVPCNAKRAHHRVHRAFSPDDLRLEPRDLGLSDLGATSEPPCAYPAPSCT